MVWSARFRSGRGKLGVGPISCGAVFAPAPPPLRDRACMNACNDLCWSQFSARPARVRPRMCERTLILVLVSPPRVPGPRSPVKLPACTTAEEFGPLFGADKKWELQGCPLSLSRAEYFLLGDWPIVSQRCSRRYEAPCDALYREPSVAMLLSQDLITSPHSGMTWDFQFVFVAASASAMTLACFTSKPFELNLRYLGPRKYRSGKMYWMTFLWPWPKVTAGALTRKLLLCRIKWEPLNQSLQNLVAIALWSCLLPD